MSPTLRNLSPRVTSAAISAGARRWSAGDGGGGGKVGRDVACGVVCSSSGAGEARGGVGSGTREARAGAGVATGDAGFCFAGSRGGASAAEGGVVSGARAGWTRSGVAAGELSRRVSGAFAGAELVPRSADCGIGTGCGVAAIGGTLETIGARSVGAAFAGISLGVDCGAEASRVGEVPMADRPGGSPARLT
jgi:hypothetical protein